MKILLSAFACDPEEGSEPGVGWSWAYHLAKAGHDVTILTRDFHQAAVEAGIQAAGLPNLRGEYVAIRLLPFWMPYLGVYPYYMLWQWKAYFRARQMHRERPFDLAHHTTYATFRNVSYMYRLGVPFIFGPVGGGESAPRALRASMSPKAKFFEVMRDCANLLPRINPFWRQMLRQSACVVVKTEETRSHLPRRIRAKAFTCVDNMIAHQPYLAGDSRRGTPLRLLFAGRMLSWKGIHLAVRAIAQVAGQNAARLTIVGKGQEELNLREEVRRLGIEDRIEFIPWLSRAECVALHATHDAFLFPSLHDSGGTVVMEAIAHGRPVICLDLGGPAVALDQHCARIVDTRGKTEEQVVDGLARVILELSQMSSSDWEEMRLAAVRRAQAYSPEKIISRVYERVLAAGALPSRT